MAVGLSRLLGADAKCSVNPSATISTVPSVTVTEARIKRRTAVQMNRLRRRHDLTRRSPRALILTGSRQREPKIALNALQAHESALPQRVLRQVADDTVGAGRGKPDRAVRSNCHAVQRSSVLQ